MIKRTERICNKGANSVGYIKESHDELSTRVCMISNEKKVFLFAISSPIENEHQGNEINEGYGEGERGSRGR